MSRIKALLLVGSPRGERSNSNAFGSYLMKKMESHGAETNTEFLVRLAKSPAGLEKLKAAVDEADVIVIAAPLYIDSIPAHVIRALEHIRDARKAGTLAGKRQRLFVIVNSGFPRRNITTSPSPCTGCSRGRRAWNGPAASREAGEWPSTAGRLRHWAA